MFHQKIFLFSFLFVRFSSYQSIPSNFVDDEFKFNFRPDFKSNLFGFNPASKSFPQTSPSSSNENDFSSSYRSEDKKTVKISNKVGRGINLICNIISSNWTFLDSNSAALDVDESLIIKIFRDENELYPWVKCIGIWYPYSVGFMAFNARNTPASNNNIIITSNNEAFLVKGKRRSKLEPLD